MPEPQPIFNTQGPCVWNTRNLQPVLHCASPESAGEVAARLNEALEAAVLAATATLVNDYAEMRRIADCAAVSYLALEDATRWTDEELMAIDEYYRSTSYLEILPDGDHFSQIIRPLIDAGEHPGRMLLDRLRDYILGHTRAKGQLRRLELLAARTPPDILPQLRSAQALRQ